MSRNHETPAFRLSRRLRLLIVVLAAWTGEAVADTYIILSLVGDRVTIVRQEPKTGSHLDQNRYEVARLTEPVLDDFAVRVADATIGKARPDASVITLRASDPRLYALRDSWLDANAIDVQALLSLVAKQFPPSPDAHLLLITPYRDQPELKTDRHYRGTGTVAGLGFYLDHSTRLRSHDTMESAVGFLGVFAHFQLVLINLQTSAIEAHERVVVGTTYAASRSPDLTPWNALTQAQKTRALESLMKREIERLLPAMLVSRRP